MLYSPYLGRGEITMKKLVLMLIVGVLVGCEKPNSKPTYGDTGLPKNCRAIIQANIDEYRRIRATHEDYGSQMIDIDGVFSSIERNCGAYGYSWEYK